MINSQLLVSTSMIFKTYTIITLPLTIQLNCTAITIKNYK